MKKWYLIFTLLGFIPTTTLVIIESIQTGNWLLYTDIMATAQAMFSNRISTIFHIDLLWAVLVFMVWSLVEARRLGIRKITGVWIITFLLGFAGGFPLFLYLRECALEANRS